MHTPSAYPLHWPAGWPRTDALRRESSRMKTQLPAALKNLQREVNLLGGRNLILSSNVTLGAEKPADPGVVAYFERAGQHIAIPCDRWRTVAENTQAIAKTIEAIRGMDRWGAKHMIKAMFQGFAALPEAAVPRTGWRDVLGLAGTITREHIDNAFRHLAKQRHPDHGGTDAAMSELIAARDAAYLEIPV